MFFFVVIVVNKASHWIIYSQLGPIVSSWSSELCFPEFVSWVASGPLAKRKNLNVWNGKEKQKLLLLESHSDHGNCGLIFFSFSSVTFPFCFPEATVSRLLPDLPLISLWWPGAHGFLDLIKTSTSHSFQCLRQEQSVSLWFSVPPGHTFSSLGIPTFMKAPILILVSVCL